MLEPADKFPRLDVQIVDQIRQLGAARPGLYGALVALFDRNTEGVLVDAKSQIERQAYEGLRIAFHSLKGSATSLGAKRLGVLAAAMETGCIDRVSEVVLRDLLYQIQQEFEAVRRELAAVAESR